MARGISRREIFHSKSDYQKYLETLLRIKNENQFEVLAYCLMPNHLHLLLKETKESISISMQRMGTSYAWWYNGRYEHAGHVFQNRFKSECVEDDSYLLTVIRYIHQNPVKAGITDKSGNYPWSSCSSYYGEAGYPIGLTQTDMILQMFSENRQQAIREFRIFNEESNKDECLDCNKRKRVSDDTLQQEIIDILCGQSLATLHTMEKNQRNRTLQQIKQIEGSTLRQISRITGIGVKIIFNA